MGIANDLATLDATAQAELVRNGSASAAELVEAAIEAAHRIAAQLEAAQPWASRRPPVSA